jgi:chromosome segregation ATPase
MDGATFTIPKFRTPVRILIPKLVKSRDGWKTKANDRKKVLKAARIRLRDLLNSRDNWKHKVHDAENRIVELEQQLAQAQQDLAAASAEIDSLRDELKKK